MSSAAFAVTEAPIAQPVVVAEKKTPPKRTLTALSDPVLVPEAR
jgi:hypothetical protein